MYSTYKLVISIYVHWNQYILLLSHKWQSEAFIIQNSSYSDLWMEGKSFRETVEKLNYFLLYFPSKLYIGHTCMFYYFPLN